MDVEVDLMFSCRLLKKTEAFKVIPLRRAGARGPVGRAQCCPARIPHAEASHPGSALHVSSIYSVYIYSTYLCSFQRFSTALDINIFACKAE